MKLNDFKIDQIFFTATGAWKCLDVGTRTVVARPVRLEYEDWAWDAVEADVFYPHDFDGCFLTSKERAQ